MNYLLKASICRYNTNAITSNFGNVLVGIT